MIVSSAIGSSNFSSQEQVANNAIHYVDAKFSTCSTCDIQNLNLDL